MKLATTILLAATAVSASISAFEDNYLDVLSFDQSIVYLGDDATQKDVHTLSKWSWNDCGGNDDALKLTKIDVSPDPPQSGRNLTIDAAGIVNRYIAEGAYADVSVKLGYITLYHTRFDLCKEAHDADAQIQCPVEAGERAITQNVELPSHIPPAAYTLQVRANTVDDTPLACLNFRLSFLPFLSVFD
ncbi:hypothetical protein WALSEDRAFT_60421 [Wallemia mellicola CBS 633.66]|uniref:Phosphatidylglycerol/phosphatidylinositol transfer protein n=2 Tax=Wallemia mellicola TaxID=1708541 RepID=A0A4T0S8Q5_9BASI|nr:hypothetical protein WALSEDRAFT_60421 [Wallemia mellicola CBS 633.66]TIB86450.1 hypothetical protein E3Q21_01692 [Wallemia mellicola]EIM21420.1 hypothetical protein WALSEDRAFT_60421 [Wallemia mellicola CBS 633.66]TIB89399.1 hypothetical protein E3Q20_01682 [Wallemia mellicola]TIB99453.1 hypothetical protein E3Q17_02633 [Wallemia mellicola]TIC10742.1 hypothetical protein E3Q14_02671 [Wallemia mellicola]|eukprot:XP_006958451.1 hypothetical protein WALSEDRAFT_60421 [Wallemia mellicola CBS 633.66]